MAEVKSPEQKHSALEREIQILSAELKTLKPETEAEKEALKSLLKSRIYGSATPSIPGVLKKTEVKDRPKILPEYLETAPKDIKLEVEKLLDLAWHKGIAAAAQEAKKNEPLIIDGFHDALTDKLYEEFKKRKLIK